MKSTATTIEDYLEQLPAERKEAMKKLRQVITKNLPKGFKEQMTYGMIGWVVPHSLYPPGYHCDPALPLGFISIASQKNFIAVYHMGIYADKNLLDWFLKAYAETGTTKPDMGKSCIRFKKVDKIPYELLGELAGKVTPQQWIDRYESAFLKDKK